MFRPRLLVIPTSGCSGEERWGDPAVRREACRPPCSAAPSPAPARSGSCLRAGGSAAAWPYVGHPRGAHSSLRVARAPH